MKTFTLEVEPGICGFACKIMASSEDRKTAEIEIAGSGCTMVEKLAAMVTKVTFRDMFVPLTRNRVFVSAEKAGCHLACPVPVAVAKAAEAALVLALPQDVIIHF